MCICILLYKLLSLGGLEEKKRKEKSLTFVCEKLKESVGVRSKELMTN